MSSSHQPKPQFFHFKQFSIEQTHCAMKVGTDGILLGGWADLENAKSVLDMGTGTGLIALMTAQRLATVSQDFSIVAIEKDEMATKQAQKNFLNSPWKENIQLYCGDITEILPKIGACFDHILANPPYFPKAQPCKNQARDLARYTELSHLDWLTIAANFLTETGKISFVLPFDAAQNLIENAPFHCIRKCIITTKIGKLPSRMIVSFSRVTQPCKEESLVIYDNENKYTIDFINKYRDFYLKM